MQTQVNIVSTVVPQTLFEMAGARLEAARLSDAALVVIDAQHEYLDGALPLYEVEATIVEIGRLLARARAAGTPVIHVVHRGTGVLFNPDRRGFEIVAPLKPLPGETMIEKMRVSAFVGTKLEEAIQGTGRNKLIVAGFMTHNCVSSTARAAMDKGYLPTVVAAATATRDLPGMNGDVLPAPVLQTASLAALADRNAVVVQAESDIAD